MRKRWKGYYSIEASLIMPIVLFLYLMIILAAVFLYCRCVISQDIFLLGMRAGSFTYGKSGYGEVIYGEEGVWTAEDYVQERLDGKKYTYPLYPYIEGSCVIEKERVKVKTTYKAHGESLVKWIQRYNPVRMIKEGRKTGNAGNKIL